MLRQRIQMILIYMPVILLCIWLGGWLFAAGVALVLSLAGTEFAGMFRREGQRPSRFLILAGVVTLVALRRAAGFEHTPLLLTLLLLGTMAWHLLDFERGAGRSGTDFALTILGMLYLGWLGAFLVSLRDLPDGRWWVLLTMFTIWFADGGAYLGGSRYGRRQMAPRLSPKKSWEGYLTGVVAGTAVAVGLAALFAELVVPLSTVDVSMGLAVGVVVSCLAPLGDLGASMIKRELKVKDSGTLFPGHGGAFDRLDTWLWAGALAYHVVQIVPA